MSRFLGTHKVLLRKSLLDGLVSFWPMQETTGTRRDVHGTNHLTQGVGGSPEVGSAAGHVESLAADFVLTSNHNLEVADNSTLRFDLDWTINLWFYLDVTTGHQALVGKYNNFEEFAIGYETVSFGGIHANLNFQQDTVSAGTVSAGGWHMATVKYDAGVSLSISLDNGAWVTDSALVSDIIDSAVPLRFGAKSSVTHRLDGRISHTGYWGRLVTDFEKTQLWNGGAGLTYAGMS
jgi:Concanavalin A-like lectin/glucanases superfamily